MRMENLLNCARKSRLVHVVAPRYMAVVFGWLYKGGSQDLYQFLKHRCVLRHFYSKEKEKIMARTKPANMDVTLLYKLLLYACDIPPQNPKQQTSIKEGQKPSLGQILCQVKDIRNEESHKNPEKLMEVSDNVLDALAKELTQLFTQMLTLAGRAGEQCKSTIAKVISNMEADVAAARRAEGGITVDQFVSLGRQELLQKWRALECSYIEPRLVVKTLDPSFGSVILLSELFSSTFQDGSRPQVIQVTGEVGAGKTSLCRALGTWWLRKDPRAQTIMDYHLVLSVTCAHVNSSDLHRHLRAWTIPNTTASCDASRLTRLLREAKILWLVDGWDEATREARCLLQELLHSRAESHTVLVTCRPELSAFLAEHFLGERVFHVSFAGLQTDERKKLITGMNLPRFHSKSLEVFLNHLHSFTIEEQQDLNNPLKLRLMAELWCVEQSIAGERRSLSLSRIYLFMIKRQRHDLIARCHRDAAPGQRVAQKVDTWLRRLYEVSFYSAKSNPSLILDGKSVDILLEECGIRTTLCLSTFLGCTPGVEASSHCPIRAFSHNSQRCVYATQHLKYCCEGVADAEAKLKELLEANSRELDDHVDPYLGVYDLVIQLLLVVRIFLSRVSCGWICHEARRKDFHEAVSRSWRKFVHLARGVHLPADRWDQASFSRSRLVPVLLQVMEMWAEGLFQASVSAKFLADMFASLLEGNGDPTRWLEVIRRCGDNGDLVKEVSQKINTKLWVINDGDVRAATILLQHVTPAEVTVIVSGDPKRLPHLHELLSKLAERSVGLGLHIRSHFHVLGSKDFSDTYLELVCRKESKCLLNTFTGHLSTRGLYKLTTATSLTSLSIRITQDRAVYELTALTPKLSCLQALNLVYDSKRFVVPDSSLDGSLGVVMVNGIKSILTLNGLRDLVVHLQLPHLRETSVNTAIDFISGLSKRYVTLIAGKLEQRAIKNLIAGLKNNSVSVGDFKILVYVKEYGRHFLVNLGSLPIQVPLGDFLGGLHDLFQDPFSYRLLKKH